MGSRYRLTRLPVPLLLGGLLQLVRLNDGVNSFHGTGIFDCTAARCVGPSELPWKRKTDETEVRSDKTRCESYGVYHRPGLGSGDVADGTRQPDLGWLGPRISGGYGVGVSGLPRDIQLR